MFIYLVKENYNKKSPESFTVNISLCIFTITVQCPGTCKFEWNCNFSPFLHLAKYLDLHCYFTFVLSFISCFFLLIFCCHWDFLDSEMIFPIVENIFNDFIKSGQTSIALVGSIWWCWSRYTIRICCFVLWILSIEIWILHTFANLWKLWKLWKSGEVWKFTSLSTSQSLTQSLHKPII